jgi:CP family cyanate transporter-like MFS transporter
VGLALSNALFPLAAREWVESRPLGATAAYTTGMQFGAGATSLAAVPLALWLGGWTAALAVISLTAIVALGAWLFWAPKEARATPRSAMRGFHMPWRSALAWRLAIAMGLLGMCFWGVNSWLTGAFMERGWSEVAAAAIASMLNVGAVVGNIAVFFIGEGAGSRRMHMIGASTVICAGTILLILMPGGAFAWAVMIGVGNGLLFPALMTLPLDIARDTREVAEVAGMMLGVGYVMSGLAPFFLGFVRDMTGSFESVLWISAALAAMVAVTVAFLSPARLTRGMQGGRREAVVPATGGS